MPNTKDKPLTETLADTYLGDKKTEDTQTGPAPTVTVLTQRIIHDTRNCGFCGKNSKARPDERVKAVNHVLYRCFNCGNTWKIKKSDLEQLRQIDEAKAKSQGK